jgi:hypothetical protein
MQLARNGTETPPTSASAMSTTREHNDNLVQQLLALHRDCADLRFVPTLTRHAMARREIPTRDIGTILSARPAARLRFGSIAGAGLACCYPILGDGIGVKRWHR